MSNLKKKKENISSGVSQGIYDSKWGTIRDNRPQTVKGHSPGDEIATTATKKPTAGPGIATPSGTSQPTHGVTRTSELLRKKRQEEGR